MTKLYLLHRQDQMDAARAEFRQHYAPIKAALRRNGHSARDIAMKEWDAWRAWIEAKMGNSKFKE